MSEITGAYDSYQPIENTVGRTDRYRYAKVTRGGSEYFMKQALVPDEAENLRRELGWHDFIADVSVSYPALHLRPLTSVALEEGTLVTEWVNAPLVAQPRDAPGWKRHLARYTAMLVALDEMAGRYRLPDDLRDYTPRNAEERLDVWLRNGPDTPLVRQARSLFTSKVSGLHSRMQHGDLTPWQILDDDGTWIIIDGERSGEDLPRFNDVAYSYGRLAARCDDEESADMLLASFISQRALSEAEIADQLYPVIILRLLGMFGDAAEEPTGSEYANVEHILQKVLRRIQR